MSTGSLFSLTGKTAIVTGGTGGIGLSVVPSLAELGADIVSIQVPDDAQTPALRSAIEQHARTLTVFDCNLKDAAAIRATFARIWDAGIVPDILLHVAGVTHSSKIIDTSTDVMDHVRLYHTLEELFSSDADWLPSLGYRHQRPCRLPSQPGVRTPTHRSQATR